jgi:hypothetical protein
MTATSERATATPGTVPGCHVTLVELDFEARRERAIALEDAAAAMARGRFVWIDVDVADVADGRRLIAGLGLVSDDVVDLAQLPALRDLGSPDRQLPGGPAGDGRSCRAAAGGAARRRRR